jgi:hypothetical protein
VLCVLAGSAPLALGGAQTAETGYSQLVEEAALFAELSLELEREGIEPLEEREAFADAIAELLREADTEYVEGMAYVASLKARWGYHVAALGPEELRSILAYIASGECRQAISTAYIAKAAEAVGMMSEARSLAEELAAHSCPASKHMLALILLVPPGAGNAQEA